MRPMNKTLRGLVLGMASLAMLLSPWSIPVSAAATSSGRPQIVIAIGNSESMDGDLGGAIMTGSGLLSSSLNSLYNTSSPQYYTVPTGFPTPAASVPAGSASAPYTVKLSSGRLVDNSASRLNVAKQGIKQVLKDYLPSMDFALEDYATSQPTYYNTWVYYMSPSGGFAFSDANKLPANAFLTYSGYQAFAASNPDASPAPTRWVSNPCYNYGKASSTVSSNCSSIANLYGSTALSKQYMEISASSDDPDVNDVLYAGGGLAAIGVAYNGPYPSNPYSAYTLANYNAGLSNILSTYYSSYPGAVATQTTPTNAGYIPFSPQVMYAQRGFGYSATPSPSTGSTVVAMTNLGSNPSPTQVSSALSTFTSALAPETSSTNSSEIKASAGQATTAGLVQGAAGAFTSSACGKYVILVTDGLPTMDLSGSNWPPLGSAAALGYKVHAAFYQLGSDTTYKQYGIVNDSSNTGGAIGALDTANTNDQALTDTITAIQALYKKGIKTYVIGLGAGVDQTANPAAYDALNAMAIAGGTQQEYPASTVGAFSAALDTITATIYGETVAAAPAVPSYVNNGTLAYLLTSNNLSNQQQGMLKAYTTDATGNVSTSPAWQLQMNAAQRQSDLMTDSGNGTSVSLLANQSASAFGSPTTPTSTDIINYTIDPSYNGGVYLAGRASGSFLGTITSHADKPVLLPRPNNPYFIGSSSYRSFAQANASRTPLVLFTANDGFLYGVSAGTSTSAGTLQWAWIPSVLLPQLQYYQQFEGMNPMTGGLTTADSADSSGNWATYVVGTGYNGALHYDLKLTGCNASTSACTPSISKVWFDYQSGATAQPVNAPQAPQVWWDANNVAYAYYFTTSGSTSYLNVMRLYDGSTSSVALNFTPSSTSYVNVSAGQLFVGDTSGNVWSIDLTSGTTAGKLSAPTLVGTEPNASGAGPIRYLGEAETSTGIYLWATSDHQVTMFKFTGGAVTSTASTGWTPWWWSSTNGSGSASITTASNGNTTSTMVNTTSNPGVGSTTAPYWLDAGSTITDASGVSAGTLIVPVTVAQQATCGTDAQYDFFDLSSGTFPQKKFYDLNKNYLTANPVIGLGVAYSPVISQNGSGSAIVYGTASQNLNGKVGFQVAATSGLHVGPGVVGWQPVWITQP